MVTDLPIVDIYDECQELCFSEQMNIFGEDVMIVNRLSANLALKRITEKLQENIPLHLFFLVGPINKHELVYLFISDDSAEWEHERELLQDQIPMALILNINDMTTTIQQISFKIIGGGPQFSGIA